MVKEKDKKKKGKKMLISTEFFNDVIESNTAIKKGLDELVKGLAKIQPKIASTSDIIFWCSAISFLGVGKEEAENNKARTLAFRKQLDKLMKQYKISQVSASLFKKL